VADPDVVMSAMVWRLVERFSEERRHEWTPQEIETLRRVFGLTPTDKA
jgi:hypothetical protein